MSQHPAATAGRIETLAHRGPASVDSTVLRIACCRATFRGWLLRRSQTLESCGVLGDFLAWSPSRRREHLVAIEGAKRPGTRRRRIERTIEELRKRSG